jgi:hypothetical protein
MMTWLTRVLGGISQTINAAFLGGHQDESISGRSYRSGWIMTTRLIDALVFWEKDHCKRSHEADVARAYEWVKRYPR